MANIEYKIPIRSEYANETDYIYACGRAIIEHQRATIRAIDRSILAQPFTAKVGHDKPTARERAVRDLKTIHDYLADRPTLLARYKEIGPAALLEL